ncbi:hypothetical protein [Tuwongella immobilis]|uniref:: Response_reg n=1 Tax=Tuwongella immobilis TaxID=692036 RepID=A0A6C2YLL4_9BACT|nr:hypothetical protein [Tuwongella immobilis]VIP02013.1 : Response_reg [Tuwongella immobilis]VTS00125.1 : Response_reg [Tuwongella immobilis]
MRAPLLVIYENPGSFSQQLEQITHDRSVSLAQMCEPIARDHHWLVREPRQRPACLALLQQERHTVLILKLERKLIDEMSLLAAAAQSAPHVPIIVVNDVKLDADSRNHLTALAYDLGAHTVLFPPFSPDSLIPLILGSLPQLTE